MTNNVETGGQVGIVVYNYANRVHVGRKNSNLNNLWPINQGKYQSVYVYVLPWLQNDALMYVMYLAHTDWFLDLSLSRFHDQQMDLFVG